MERAVSQIWIIVSLAQAHSCNSATKVRINNQQYLTVFVSVLVCLQLQALGTVKNRLYERTGKKFMSLLIIHGLENEVCYSQNGHTFPGGQLCSHID